MFVQDRSSNFLFICSVSCFDLPGYVGFSGDDFSAVHCCWERYSTEFHCNMYHVVRVICASFPFVVSSTLGFAFEAVVCVIT